MKLEQEDFDPTEGMTDQEKWEKVTARIDFQAKGTNSSFSIFLTGRVKGSCTKDTSRMRQVLLHCKAGTAE